MSEPFLIAFREAFQCSLLFGMLLFYPAVQTVPGFRRSLTAGVLAALASGALLGFFPDLTKNLLALETWIFWRYTLESIVFYSGIALVLARPPQRPAAVSAGLFLLGFSLAFFEARSTAFLLQDAAAMKGNLAGTLLPALGGLGAGFLPLLILKKQIGKIPFEKTFTAASLLLMIGALQFGFGGVGELEKENILAPLQRNLVVFISSGIHSLQTLLLIPEHPFMDIPLDGLARYFASDRSALALTLAFLMAPPLFMLNRIFAKPDPLVDTLQAGAERRHVVAFFRKDIIARTVPVMTSFIVLVILLHAVNVSLNPLYEPPPVPVREGENKSLLKIALSDKSGSFEDRKMRKFLYYYGNRQIIFIAMMKPDGSVGVALDECEICRPADWNTDAKGYAQKGDHLICKYCMTPIASATLNSPGGCNPIPIPFKVEDSEIRITLEDLISTFRKLQEFEKKGTHL